VAVGGVRRGPGGLLTTPPIPPKTRAPCRGVIRAAAVNQGFVVMIRARFGAPIL